MLWQYPGEAPERLAPLALAYVGDAVFELYIRSTLAAKPNKVNTLHRQAVELVSARAMAAYYKKLEAHLAAEELEILHRGRNAKSRHNKSAGVGEYHMSTGFEALVGYLFLSRQEQRLEQLLRFLLEEEEESDET